MSGRNKYAESEILALALRIRDTAKEYDLLKGNHCISISVFDDWVSVVSMDDNQDYVLNTNVRIAQIVDANTVTIKVDQDE